MAKPGGNGAVRRKNGIRGAEYLQFNCERCASCCHLWVPVTDEDVRRLMDTTALPAEAIVEFVARSRVQSQDETIVWIKFGPKKADERAMCIRDIYDRCLFLRNRRCSVYESRPFVCREHPFVVELDDSRAKIASIELNAAENCSYTLRGKLSKNEIKKMYRLNLAQDERYAAKVRRWNRRENPGSERDFIRFLGLYG